MPTLQSSEIELALEYFDRTLKSVEEAIGGLSGAQWQFKPAPDRWSIAENLEHMVTVQERILGPLRQSLAQAPPAPANHDPGVVDRICFERIPDRSIRANAPEPTQPKGGITVEAALDRLARNYDGLAEFVQSTPGLREHAVESKPLKFVTNGKYEYMDGYQWALTVASHDQRHLRQILEVQADPNYPQN